MKTTGAQRGILLTGLGLLLGCVSPVDEPGSKVPDRCAQQAPLIAPQKTDILFVIDNSGSMAEEQEGVAQELPAFIEELERGGGVGHDFQVGVITTAVYQHALVQGVYDLRYYPNQSGLLQAVPVPDGMGGLMPGTERVLSSEDPELVEKFARLVRQGTMGSGQETPFESVRLAVTEQAAIPMEEGGNKGFLRDGARLLIVVVTDEDDCSEIVRPPSVFVGTDPSRDYCGEKAASLTRVEEYAAIFDNLTDSAGARRDVLWAAIAPVGREDKQAQAVVDNGVIRNVDCPTSFQPGHRQRAMAALFDETLANLDSICNTSYRDTLVSIAQIANAAQSFEVHNVPDERLLKVEVTRADGQVQACTVANGGITYLPGTEELPGRIQFNAPCPRKFDDQAVELKMICAG